MFLCFSYFFNFVQNGAIFLLSTPLLLKAEIGPELMNSGISLVIKQQILKIEGESLGCRALGLSI